MSRGHTGVVILTVFRKFFFEIGQVVGEGIDSLFFFILLCLYSSFDFLMLFLEQFSFLLSFLIYQTLFAFGTKELVREIIHFVVNEPVNQVSFVFLNNSVSFEKLLLLGRQNCASYLSEKDEMIDNDSEKAMSNLFGYILLRNLGFVEFIKYYIDV